MGNEEEWQGDESITILIVAAHTARHSSLVSSPTPPCYCTKSSGLLGPCRPTTATAGAVQVVGEDVEYAGGALHGRKALPSIAC